MNEVSIILNGVRYDLVPCIGDFHSCKKCDLLEMCDDGDYYNQAICEKLQIDSPFQCFKKSTKSFER